MAAWNASRPDCRPLTLAVNISPVQLGQDDFVESGISCLGVTGLRPDLLILEITEGPADIVKIDQSFVRDLHATTGSVFLVTAVMDLAKSLGLDVIAEGVETPEQQGVLNGLGCRHSQGFLHSNPLTAEALTALLKVTSDTAIPPAQRASIPV